MSNDSNTVEQFPTKYRQAAPNGNGGSGGDGRGLDARVAVLEAELKHLATKDDLSKLKLWVVVGAFGLFVQFIGVVVLLVKAFS